MKYNSGHGFTLIELSIVLVIIGLVIGGIMVGKDLIHAAQIKTIISEKEKYATAVNAFRVKYNAIPGDMKNATDFWGISAGNASDNYTDSCYAGAWPLFTGFIVTCNGNDDGMIAGCSDGMWQIFCSNEIVTVWQHLANAELIEGRGHYMPIFAPYIPQGGGARGPYLIAGQNIPASKINTNIGWALIYTCIVDTTFPTSNCGHMLFFGTQTSVKEDNWHDLSAYPALTTMDAKMIDTKIDNGLPGSGTVTSFINGNYFTPDCATTADAATAIYDLSKTGPKCSLMFNAGF